MRRVLFAALIVALLLAGCGGTPADTTVPAPPQSTAFEKGDNQKINQLVDQLQSQVPAELKSLSIKDTAEQPIVQAVYQSTASLQQIADFYKTLTEKGWVEAQKMPGIQDGVLITGYNIGNTTLVVNAVDAAPLGGSGVVIYTVKGTK
jgi:outer membrane murein-binding lipoprotein Lpp